jgi:hypothetical protein
MVGILQAHGLSPLDVKVGGSRPSSKKAVDIVSAGPMPCHCLLGDGVALPAALKVVEDFELKFGHNVVMLCSNAIPNHCESLVEYSSFLGGEGLEILRFRNSLGYTGWIIRHCVEELELGIGKENLHKL